MSKLDVVHLKPNYYTHVLDQNSTATALKVGPETFTKREHEQILIQPSPFIVVPPRHYLIIDNPVDRDEAGKPNLDKDGQARVRLGDQEIRVNCPPFPLYPGEKLNEKTQKPQPLQVLDQITALRLKALRDFEDEVDGSKIPRVAGDEWMVCGPCTYYPHICREVVQTVKAQFVNVNEALKLTAINTFTDRTGVERKVGAQWLWTQTGAFLPSVDEKVLEVVQPKILTETKAIHVKCVNPFKDCFGQERLPGDQWLVTHKDTATYLPTPNESVMTEVQLLVLNKKQYCIVMDPFDTAKKQVQLGVKKLIRGPDRFFLHPYERLVDGCAQDVHVLMADEALLLEALEAHKGDDGVEREAGDLWMIKGPREYVPPVTVEVVETRRSIPMHEYEGVYIRDLKSGQVRAQMGPVSYMLEPTEELWEKELPVEVEQLLAGRSGRKTGGGDGDIRDKTRVVVYSVPHNSLAQIFDYKQKTSRCVYGPDMLSLNPDEEFTVISLSGGKPKRPNVIKALALFLGPDFMTDNIRVETADHARLELQLSYNWRFDINVADEADCKRVFSVHDFVGDSCKAIASRIRGCCAGETFDNFHKNSSSIIRHAVFGSYSTYLSMGRPIEVGTTVVDKATGTRAAVTEVSSSKTGVSLTTDAGKTYTSADDFSVAVGVEEFPATAGKWPNSELPFPTNGLVISNVDIQSVEPVDQKTKDSLLKSVQLAIHITTQGQEAQAKHRATEEEQKAKGELESQLIRDKAESEKERKVLLQLRAESQSIEATGSQRAEAQAAAEAAAVEAQCMVDLATKRAEAQKIQVRTEIDIENSKNSEMVNHKKTVDSLEVDKARDLAKIESSKFANSVKSMGKETIEAIAKAGPENQVRLLKALNLQGYMVTDGSSPINLFNAAQGMTGGAPTSS
eukprot:TRINITY_DN259_c0_g2_i2.p1 TRINITY_DN259_c0_g2~~TRINITY_DN259_c0_g2_i2.p1  ORF type:complete len:907 (+),score=495.19 TRINITY_DN259_c0_g2_i2:65-2785(+)